MCAGEIAEAKKELDKMDSKQRKSKMQCMNVWLKRNDTNDGTANEAAANSVGNERENYLAAYLAFIAKQKSNQVKTTIESKRTTEIGEEVEWFCQFQLEKKYDPEKTKTWLDAKALTCRPDLVT